MDKDNFTETTPAMTVYVTADKKDYFNCSMYYMRRFFGLREILILAILVIVGLVLFFAMAQTFILILFGVCVVLILIAFILFLITSIGGYKVDMEKRGIAKQKLEFNEDAIIVTNIDAKGNPIYIETHPYDRIEKVSVKRKRVYIYAQVSVFYYIIAKKQEPGVCEEVAAFLKKTMKPEAFKIKKKVRALPKKKKLTLEED